MWASANGHGARDGIGLFRLFRLSRLFRLFGLSGLFRAFRMFGLKMKKTRDCQVFGARFPRD